MKHEIECYLHPDAIKDAFGVTVEVTDHPNEHGKACPKVFAEAFSFASGFDAVMGDDKAKLRLADKAFPLMTAERLRQRDPSGEVISWLRQLQSMF